MGLTREQRRALFFRLAAAVIGRTRHLPGVQATILGLNHATFFSISGHGSVASSHPDTDMATTSCAKRVISWATGTLSLLFYRGRDTADASSPLAAPPDGCRLLLVWTLAVASADEYHQSFLPSRTGVPQDVLLDIAGGPSFSCCCSSGCCLGDDASLSLRPRKSLKREKCATLRGFQRSH